MDELPIYESRRHAKGLWQNYRVFRDRVELRSVFGFFRIKMEDIEEISVSPSLMALMAKGQMGKAAEIRAAKLDMADFVEHVVLRTRKGVFRVLRFTPDNPLEFVYSVQSAMRHYPKMMRQPSTPAKVESPRLRA
jgi:hypothetical protein